MIDDLSFNLKMCLMDNWMVEVDVYYIIVDLKCCELWVGLNIFVQVFYCLDFDNFYLEFLYDLCLVIGDFIFDEGNN